MRRANNLNKIIVSILTIMGFLNTAFAGGYISDPITSRYAIYITNNTDIEMNLVGLNLNNPFSIDKDRLFEASQFAAPNSRWSSLAAHSTKAFALAVRNYKEGFLDIELDTSGTRFRISQTKTVHNLRDCFNTQTLPPFACVLDMSLPEANSKVSLSKVGHIDPTLPIGSSIELFIAIDKK